MTESEYKNKLIEEISNLWHQEDGTVKEFFPLCADFVLQKIGEARKEEREKTEVRLGIFSCCCLRHLRSMWEEESNE